MIIAFQTLIYFRESLLTALDWLFPIWPYYKKWTLTKKDEELVDDEEEHVFADYDEEKGVIFYPPVYAQRYAAVADCLMDARWADKIKKVVDFGYNDMSFIKYLKDVPGIKCILGVDIESLPLRCSPDLLGFEDYGPRRETPLQITLYQGNAADPDYRLIGCDAVVAIEMIEHMLPHDLERLLHTVFGFIKPQIAVFTTPNGDFNVLFKALEKNGLRRLDHFFEWSREQFHDWCSNIVLRYPDYTVTCKGIGPGPLGTQSLGCCTQLALFICKDYHKQQDLDINCLALVANAPQHNDFDDMTDSWVSPDPITEANMLCAPDNTESFGELLHSEKHSSLSLNLVYPESFANLEYKDKISQCNIEAERGKNFLMFDDEILCYNVLIPKRKIDTKVYEFENVANRLNCSTLQVRRFSKTTQNLMARNKLDSLVHTREIVDEIRHMTKMLNFNKNTRCSTDESGHWNNINWSVNAPYWNQYYKIIKEFNYPFEVKSVECRILDVVYDEINRLIDTHDSQFAVDANKLEIPLDHLMRAIEHLTDDVDQVKDLLEWNGYEVVDSVLVYSRLVRDDASLGSVDDEWQENDAMSDWDTTDAQSLSDASTMMPDVYGRNLRRALDLKLKRLRSLLTADEDITTELDRIVCRLMKLALRTSESRKTPPPINWMQRKLLDLLTLTEKAIERRRKHFIENYPIKTIGYDCCDITKKKLRDCQIDNDDTMDKLVDKYLKLSSDPDSDRYVVKSELHYTEENLSVTSNEMEPFPLEPTSFYGEVRLESMKSVSKEKIHLKIKKGWIDGNYDTVSPTDDYIVKSNVESSESNTSNDSHHKYDNFCDSCNNAKENKTDLHMKDKICLIKGGKSKKHKNHNNKLIKKVSKKHSSYGKLNRKFSKKFEYVEYKSYTFNKPQIESKGQQNTQSTLSKPIPRSLIELCYQDLRTEKSDKLIESSLRGDDYICDNVAATKESFLIDIVTQDLEETLALRRTIATEMDRKESEELLETVLNVSKDDSFNDDSRIPTIDSNTIFLYDLNEPSTSKGFRHVSADAQCGTDILNVCPVPSAVLSLINVPKIFETGIKISDSNTKLTHEKKSVEFGTVTDGMNFCNDLLLFTRNAIKIKDSDAILTKTVECSTMTQDNEIMVGKELYKPTINDETDSHTEEHGCSKKLSNSGFRCLKNPSDSGVSHVISVTKYIRPKLSSCGIYVHSYKDRQISEDIVFQGEWQKKGPSVLAKKNPCALLNLRKHDSIMKNKRVNSNEKVECPLGHKNVIKVSKKKSSHKLNDKFTKSKRDLVTKDGYKKTKDANFIIKNVRNCNNVSKVASKFVSSVTISRSLKNISASKSKPKMKCNNSNLNISSKLKYPLKTKEEQSIFNPRGLNSCTSRIINKGAHFSKSPIQTASALITSKQDIDKKEFRNKNQKNLTYLVFRNEIKNSRSALSSSVNSRTLPRIDGSKNDYSPSSQNSSPCSSPNSVATVRAYAVSTKSYCCKSKSTSPDKNSSGNVSLENTERQKNKRYAKSSESTNLTNQELTSCENKENLPDTSKQSETSESFSKNAGKSCKVLVGDRNKNVYMLQVRTESPVLVGRKKSENAPKSCSCSNTRIIKNRQTETQKSASPSAESKSSKNICKLCKFPVITNDDTCYIKAESSGLSEVNNLTRSSTPILDKIANVESLESAHEYVHVSRSNIKRSKSKINAAMKQLIEERLSFINRVQNNNDSDSETVILSKHDQDDSLNDDLSQVSYKTMVTNANSSNIAGRDVELALMNYSLESNLESLATLGSSHSEIATFDTPLDSFRSSESSNNITLVPQQKTMKDLYERKDQPVLKNPGGVIAVQVFSGFSMDADSAVGDRPVYTRLVDPETGILTVENTRQAASEELFVSGRSSDTYESCYVDDDAYVPNWLFNIISQQQSEEIPEAEQDEPEAEPEYDVNGNILEGAFGAGVGAGDGRGMHSDQSQDSSGRGTSISSSDVSSGPQSEAVLIDASVFLSQGANVPTIATTMPLESSETSFRTVETTETDNEPQHNRDNVQRRLNRAVIASDADADVSSLETDAADSDN